MPEFVRVRLSNGTERTVSRVTEDMTVLKKDAVSTSGRILPAKRKTSVDATATKKAASSAPTKEK